jgi:uncharacterized protein (TIGR00255 family)
MVIKSMTGFGCGEVEADGRVWTAEIRCVNHRYLDLKIKLPRGYAELEDRIRKKVNVSHLRGRVDLVLTVNGDFSDLLKVRVNTQLAKTYKDALTDLAKELELGEVDHLALISSYPDVLVREQEKEDIEEVWPIVQGALEEALGQCDLMRQQEGERLQMDLVGRLQSFAKTIAEVEAMVPVLLQQREQNLKERLEKLLGNVQLDPMRLSQEVAVIADKTDVTEELVRLHSHIEQCRNFLNEEGAVGRKLDFLIQEFLREVNTLASKINDASIAHLTVELKGELEKMREQIQNIE